MPDGASLSMPGTKAARQRLLRDLIERQAFSAQAQLAQSLAEHDFRVTQATLSRDLVEIGAVKVRTANGMEYSVAAAGARGGLPAFDSEPFEQRLQRLLGELLVAAAASGNQVVLKTPSGAAQFLASAIDMAMPAGVLGTIAGDDTVVVIAQEGMRGQELADFFLTGAGVLAPAQVGEPESD